MALLQERMVAHLADWKQSLSEDWQNVFFGVEPNFLGIPEDLEIDDHLPIFPARWDAPIDGSPNGAHLCRAFDGLPPELVRVVVLGQDPYPDVRRATGRAFEDGAWEGNATSLADSLKRLMQSAILSVRNDLEVPRDSAGWSAVRQALEDGHLELPQNSEQYFTGLVEQRVLFVNAAWTHSRSVDLKEHQALWKPILDRLIQRLASNRDIPVVFLLLGKDAQLRFCEADHVCNRAAIVANAHPSYAKTYFERKNPLLRVNDALRELGQHEIVWWPPEAAARAADGV